ncbi:MAG: TonB-dependent receptor domain-containing protein [Sphingomonas sp.]
MRTSKTYMIATLLSGVAFASPAFAAAATQPAAPVNPVTGVNPQAQPEVNSAATQQTPATQNSPAGPTPPTQGGEQIVVTGSRIVSPNITSLAPVQVIGTQEINQSGAVNIQELLNNNPAFSTPTLSTTNTAFLTSGAGVATADLRNLGINRTLILINSRRVVGGLQGSPAVDLNNIPTQFLERVDILTGGQSALYGSDAVAGVVNFIYKRNFEGLLLEGQYGLTEKGDSQRYQLSATAGGNFMDGRGNIMIHVGYSSDKGLLSRERADTRIDNISACFNTPRACTAANYGTAITPFFSSYTPQGRFFAGNGDFTFGPTGQLQPCFTSNGTTCRNGLGAGTGPNGFNRQFYRTLSTPVDRYLFAERSRFDITDNITFFTEATYAKVQARSEIEPFPLDSANINPIDATVPIQAVAGGPCNPFVPAAICAAATDYNGDGLLDMAFRRRLTDVGQRTSDARRNFYRVVAGFEGTLFNGRYHWDIGYNFGQTSEQQHSTGQINVQNFLNAMSAIPNPAGPGFICANPIAAAQGCVPLNIFGVNSITPAMLAYINADAQHNFTVQQQVWDANISGSILDLPAGPLGVAVGAEYRKESSVEDWDALTNAGLNGGNLLPDTSGKFDVKEAYGEINVPILKDLPFVSQLNARAAGRISDYSTVGSVKTWEIGGDWAPIPDVRFRATMAKAVRAPNIGELFTGLSQTFPLLTDPCEGIGLTGGGTLGANCRAAPGVLTNINLNGGVFTLTQPDKQGISGFNGGNPNLQAEKARTFTAGVVIAPRSIPFLRNASLSVDYWHIKVTDAITLLPRQLILTTCYEQSLASSCALIVRNPTQLGAASPGSLKFVNDFSINAASQTRSGIDTVFQYRNRIGTLMGDPLNMNARIAYTHQLKGYTIPAPGQAADRLAGEIGSPKDKVDATLGLDLRKWGISFTGTYIGKSYEDDQTLAGLGPPGARLGPNAISISPIFYLDGQIRFNPTRNFEFYVGANNLTNVQAPRILSGSGFNTTGSNTDEAVYDVFGRRYYAGARLRF